MEFFEILTQYDLLKEVTELAYDEGMKVRSVSVKEVTPEEVTEYYKNRIINQIIPSIYRKGLNLPKDISIREYARLSSGPIHQALALKKFDDKYYIYRMLLHHLDLTKISVAELFERIEKIYAARLTEEYYNSLLSSNNIELLIIKLCVRLEAVLKYDYKYEGSFSQMMKTYSNQHGNEDDGDGYLIESERSKLFHKLRKIRNGITHSDSSNETITKEELKKIIKYVCSLG